MENKKNITDNSNYNLKSDAVDALVNADSGEVPEFSQEELEKYRSRKGRGVPEPLKILGLKVWFAGAICFFFFWGLGTYIGSMIDMLFILGVALGMATDLLTNNVIRFIETTPGANDRWMLISRKGTVSLFLNVLYGFVVVTGVYYLYGAINWTLAAIAGNAGAAYLGVEPILFGVFCTLVDMLFVGIKNMAVSILRDAKDRARGE